MKSEWDHGAFPIMGEMVMSDGDDRRESPSPFPAAFPSHWKIARERGLAFQKLSASERFDQIAALMELGMTMIRNSPHRGAIERRMRAQ